MESAPYIAIKTFQTLALDDYQQYTEADNCALKGFM